MFAHLNTAQKILSLFLWVLFLGVFSQAHAAKSGGFSASDTAPRELNVAPDFTIGAVGGNIPMSPSGVLSTRVQYAVYKGKFFITSSTPNCSEMKPLFGGEKDWITLNDWSIVLIDVRNVLKAEVVLTTKEGSQRVMMSQGREGSLYAAFYNVRIASGRDAQMSCKDPSPSTDFQPLIKYKVTAYGPGNQTKVVTGTGMPVGPPTGPPAKLHLGCCYF